MKSTTTWFTVLSLLFILNINIYSQDPHLDVEGDVKIRGNIDIHHPDDSTSVYIGRLAGNSTSHLFGKFNSFFGSFSGLSNTDGGRNSFFGYKSGRANTTGDGNSFFGSFSGLSNTTGGSNSFFGYESGESNRTGSWNSFFGYESGEFNTTGGSNSFFGYESGKFNTTGYSNSFFGFFSGRFNTTGIENSFFGSEAGESNSTGQFNSFFGHQAGHSNSTASQNSFFGQKSGNATTTGIQNSFFGRGAGVINETGSQNTTIGADANVTVGNLTNATALGYAALVNASNKVRIGNGSVTVIEGEVAFISSSDIRLKENIQSIENAAELINDLNPVSYTRINNDSKTIEMGLIAQEVQTVLKNHGLEKSGMVHAPEGGMMSLRYNDLIAPMIAVIQAQDQRINRLEDELFKIRSLLEGQVHEITSK